MPLSLSPSLGGNGAEQTEQELSGGDKTLLEDPLPLTRCRGDALRAQDCRGVLSPKDYRDALLVTDC